MTRSTWKAALAAALLALGCGGDQFVSGLGNGGNHFYTNQLDQVAAVLAKSPAVPQVGDETLRAAFDAIARRAGDGDPEAVMVLFKVAAAQREPKKPD